jgi:Arc/MetJ-type ribon-helix-helix transcriptional regulator
MNVNVPIPQELEPYLERQLRSGNYSNFRSNALRKSYLKGSK